MVLTVNTEIVEPEYENIPEQMQALDNWVMWRAEKSTKITEDGEQVLDKVLKRTNGRAASSTDKNTWTDFHNAYQSYVNKKFDGIGFVFEKKNKIVGLDLDGHIEDGEPLTKIAEYICDNTYVEISPSGTGAHAYFIGDMPKDFKKKFKDDEGELEIYNDSRYFTFTGVCIGQDEISENQSIIDMLVETYFHKEEVDTAPDSSISSYNLPSAEIKRKMFRNDKVKALFNGTVDMTDYKNDDSRVDMALCNHLAFWTGKNRQQMDELFRESKLYRPKWDEARGNSTYGFYTIDKAISECQNVYKLSIENPKESDDYVWDDVVTFDDDQVLPFPKNIFPDWLEDYIDQVANSTQTPREMAAMGAFSALSIALTKKFNVEVYDGWIEPLNTYLLTLMPPSSKKSQVFKAMMQPIKDYQREKGEQMKSAISQRQADIEVKEKTISTLKSRLANPKGNEDVNEVSEQLKYAIDDLDNTEEIHKPTFIADDTTPEVLAKLLKENKEKIGITSAEGGIFSSIKGKYSDVSNYEVYLSGYSGDMMSTHRLSRDTVELDEPLISIGVYAQPSVIQSLPREFFDRGLMARFLYSLPKDNRGERNIRPKKRDPQISDLYYNNMKSLMNIQTENIKLKLSHEADQNLYLLQEELENRQSPESDLAENDDIGAWAGKFVGQLMRLAGLIHMSTVMSFSEYEIQRDTLYKIEKLKDYFISHMKKAFVISGVDEKTNDAEYLLEKIIHYQKDGMLKRQKLWQSVKRKISKSNDLDQLLHELEERSFIKIEEIKPKNGGKASIVLMINPTIQ